MPTPGLRLPKSEEPWYSSVDHDVEGSPSKLSGTSSSFSGAPSPPGSNTSPDTMLTTGPALGGGAAESLAPVGTAAEGVEPPTSSTEPATESTFVPNHQASAITIASASTGSP